MFKRILFIGLGGAGQRHLRIISGILPNAELIAYRQLEKTPLLNPDFSVNSDSTLESKYKIGIYHDLNDAYKRKPDLVIISTPTSLHCEHIIRASNEGAAIIVEKPGSINHLEASKVSEILKKNNTRFLISFQRRFHPLVIKLKELLEKKGIDKINYIDVKVSSYVPAWHPYEDYKKLYACKSLLGGGVLLTESHEIDFIIWLFGLPDSVMSKISSRQELSLDVEDSALISLDYARFKVNIELDFMSKNRERSIDVTSGSESYFLNLESQTLTFINNEGATSIDEIIISNDSMFENQFNYFMNSNNSSSYSDALVNNLTLIDWCKNKNISV